MERRKALVVVAHPDDETMFSGGTIAKFPWDWTIVSAAHSLDSARGHEFAVACSILGGKPIMLDMKYGGKPNRFGLDEEELHRKLQPIIDGERFDLVLTHNQEGEFGNLDHQSVNRAVRRLSIPDVWEFGFNQLQYDISIRLGESELKLKERCFQAYESQSQRIVLVELRPEENFLWRYGLSE